MRALVYDAIYAGRSPIGARAPWDIGRAQPVFTDLAARHRITGDVLDAGCGTGELALLLARHGHAVTGVDLSAVAIEQARAKATEDGLPIEFVVGDALTLPGYRDRFDTVVDCGLFDVCPRPAQAAYAAAVHRACRTGATVFMLELSAAATGSVLAGFAQLGVPPRAFEQLPQLVPADLAAAFADGWQTLTLTESAMTVRLPGAAEETTVPAIYGEFRKK
ncbi:class I SAM-dependent methyltransferase [Nocardia sp. NPDC088792]|uniref:class I SAM-dependent methyltransferase n=1 Tax=Nocardia sp. NPDC088792 TaxID=3364332 RepID=UPI00382B335E